MTRRAVGIDAFSLQCLIALLRADGFGESVGAALLAARANWSITLLSGYDVMCDRKSPQLRVSMNKMRSLPVMALWSVVWLLTPTTVFSAMPHYTVTMPEHLDNLTVRACFEGSLPDRLWTRNERAPGLLRDVRLHRQNAVVELKPEALSLSLEHAGDSGCVVYRVDLSAIGPEHWRSGNWRVQDAIILDPDLWLWLPDTSRKDQRFRLDFELPPGYDVSAPWMRIGRTGQAVSFEARERMPEWEARIALGRFDVELIELAGGRLRYALLAGEPAADTAAIREWVTSGARALVSTYGRLPVPEVQLLVVPIGHGNEPVPWGEVKRGGGDAVHLYIDQISVNQRMLSWTIGSWLTSSVICCIRISIRATAGCPKGSRVIIRTYCVPVPV